MKPYFLIFLILVFFTFGCNEEIVKADFQTPINSKLVNEEPLKVSVCELQKSPERYNHKIIEITGFFSQGFEDATIFDPECNYDQCVWWEYGGLAKSGTIYCCGDTPAVSRPKPLVVEGISISLVDDEKFKTFYKRIQRPPDTIVQSTVQGRFFSGEKLELPGGTFYGNYGHMGMCSLFAIEKVLAVDEFESSKLDYKATADTSELKKANSYQFLSLYNSIERIELQQKADNGEREWSFENPERVAIETLSKILKEDEKNIVGITTSKNLKTQLVYKWRQKATDNVFIVVLSRPYWLSFYAKNKDKVVWIPIGIYKITSYQK